MPKNTQAFLYRWTHIPTGKWYVGAHYSVGCHPEDGYICTSTEVKPLIKENTNEWEREVLVIGDPLYIVDLESRYLSLLDAKNDPMSFNRHNGNGKFHTAGRKEPEEAKKKRIKTLTGLKRKNTTNLTKANRIKANDPEYLKKLKKPKPPGHGANVSKAITGIPKSESHRKNLSISQAKVAAELRTGKSYDDIFGPERAKEVKKNMSVAQKGKPCNNPIVICPHCGKSGHSGGMSRWHFDNCKKKIK